MHGLDFLSTHSKLPAIILCELLHVPTGLILDRLNRNAFGNSEDDFNFMIRGVRRSSCIISAILLASSIEMQAKSRCREHQRPISTHICVIKRVRSVISASKLNENARPQVHRRVRSRSYLCRGTLLLVVLSILYPHVLIFRSPLRLTYSLLRS
jgi:hypothetical protein